MKIAFVGKGGSGKTTLSAMFGHYLAKSIPTTLIDADINVHVPQLFGIEPSSVPSISSNAAVTDLKQSLTGQNTKILSPAHFRKSTPPAKGSGIIDFDVPSESILKDYLYRVSNSLCVGVVGTYDTDEIGKSCYHNNLSILENILSHSTTANSVLVVDMVAGTDAFAGTLHAQFDAIVVVVEPTLKSVDVYKRYHVLAKEADMHDRLVIVANKVEDDSDIDFITKHCGQKPHALFTRSKYLRDIDRDGRPLDTSMLEKTEIENLEKLYLSVKAKYTDPNKRLEKLWKLHREYVGQNFITKQFGDLSGQIDKEFRYSTSNKND